MNWAEPLFTDKPRIFLEIAAGVGALGWTTGTGTRRNRHYLITGLTDPAQEGLRKAIYQYHRRGLDIFTLNPDQAPAKYLCFPRNDSGGPANYH